MDKRHDNELTTRLEKILTDGSVFISWNELYHWYGVQKLAAGTFRDLENRWQELSEDKQITRNGKKVGLGTLACVQAPSRYTAGVYLFGSNMPQSIQDA